MFVIISSAILGILTAVGLQYITGWYQNPYLWLLLIATIPVFFIFYTALYMLGVWIGSFILKPYTKKPSKVHKHTYNYAKLMLDGALKLMRVRVTYNGKEKLPKDGRFLLVSNHRATWDSVVQIVYTKERPFVPMSKPGNINIPVGGPYIHHMGSLIIDKDDDRAAAKSIKTASSYIKDDIASVIIYPEGRRTKTMKLGNFHAGSFKIATKAQAPIVVTSVSGTEQIHKCFPFKSAHVYYDVVKTIYYDEYKDMTTSELAAYVRDLIRDQLIIRDGKCEYETLADEIFYVNNRK